MNSQIRFFFNWCANFLTIIIILSFIGTSCEQAPKELDDILKGSMRIQVNPHKRMPLAGLITFRTEESCRVEIKVQGKIPISKSFDGFNTQHAIPVLGLYPDTSNVVNIRLITQDDEIYTGDIELKTSPLPDFFPEIEITKLDRAKMEPGFHLIELLIANFGKFLTYTVLFDDNGDIRWFLDMSSVGHIVYTDLRGQNGNWLFMNTYDILEIDELGEIVMIERMDNYYGNHDFIELDSNKLLLAGSRLDANALRRNGGEMTTKFDHIIEFDRVTNKGLKHWDLAKNLDIDRVVFNPDFTPDPEADWFHINSIDFDRKDSSIIASGRTQGVIKVDKDNNLRWILAPHVRWGKAGRSGNGFETSKYLLTAIDADGHPYKEEVQNGFSGSDSFEWFTGQHSLNILDNGNLLLFDNGMSRNFKPLPSYSRAVEYKIDEENMTVQQVWEYGRERGSDMQSMITSNVDVMPTTNNRLITAGNIRLGQDRPNAKLIEITYPDNQVVFEAKVLFKDAKGTGEKSWAQFDLLFKGHRYSIYAE